MQPLKTCSMLLWVVMGVLLWGDPTDGIAQETQRASARSPAGSLPLSSPYAGFSQPSTTDAIKQGDQVDIKVWGYPEFNATATVNEGGMITVPLVGEVKVGGLTKEQVTEQMRLQLSEYIQGDIKVTTSVVNPTNQKIAVLGAVVRQDNYPITTETSLLEILSVAGGATADSDLRHVKIIRSGNQKHPIVVDLAKHMEDGSLDRVPRVRPGDTVFIPTKTHRVRFSFNFLRESVLFLVIALSLYRAFG